MVDQATAQKTRVYTKQRDILLICQLASFVAGYFFCAGKRAAYSAFYEVL
jgi:hypothetical protein